jgi:hypothetical protein
MEAKHAINVILRRRSEDAKTSETPVFWIGSLTTELDTIMENLRKPLIFVEGFLDDCNTQYLARMENLRKPLVFMEGFRDALLGL